MKTIHIFNLHLLLPVAALAQSGSCPHIWRSGDTPYTDPAAQLQWYCNNEPIAGVLGSWYVPVGTQQATYRVN